MFKCFSFFQYLRKVYLVSWYFGWGSRNKTRSYRAGGHLQWHCGASYHMFCFYMGYLGSINSVRCCYYIFFGYLFAHWPPRRRRVAVLNSCLCVNRGLAFTVCAHFPFPCCSGLLSHFSFCGMWSLGFYARGEAEGLGSHSLCGLFAAFCVSLCLFLVLFPVGLSGLLGWFGLLCAFQVPLHNVLGRFFTCDCFPLLRVSGLTCGNGRT